MADEQKESGKAPPRLTCFAVLFSLVIALGLGLGLGLGLQKHAKSGSQPAPNSTSSGSEPPSFASFEVPPWRQSTLAYNLSLDSWNFSAPPTTRVYNLTIGEIAASPDGRSSILRVNFAAYSCLQVSIGQSSRSMANSQAPYFA